MIWLGFSEFLLVVIVAMLVESIMHSAPVLALLGKLWEHTPQYLRFCVPILIGWHVASRFHGHELASGFSFISVLWIYNAVEISWIFRLPAEKLPIHVQGDRFTTFMHPMLRLVPFNMLVMLGALLCRYRLNVRCRKFDSLDSSVK